MKKYELAKIIGITRQHLDLALTGKRNLSFTKAKKAAVIFSTPLTIWIDPEMVPYRRKAWEQIKKKEKQQ